MKELINNEFAQVSFDQQSKAIVAIWKKPATAETYQTIFNSILENFVKYGANSFVSDIHNQGLVGIESRSWLMSEILPKAYQAGLRAVAVISPKDVFSSFYVATILNAVVNNNLNVEFDEFQDVPSALAWVSRKAIAA